QRRCDLAVRLPLGDKLGDLLLGRSELVTRGGATADPAELLPGALGPERRAHGLEAFERFRKRRVRSAALLHATEHAAERKHGARALERQWERVLGGDGRLERHACGLESSRG